MDANEIFSQMTLAMSLTVDLLDVLVDRLCASSKGDAGKTASLAIVTLEKAERAYALSTEFCEAGGREGQAA